VAPEIRHLEHLSLVGGESLEGREDLPAPFQQVGALDHLFRNIFAMDLVKVRRSLGSSPEAVLPPDGVDGAMVHQREKERSKGAATGVVGLGGAPEREEGVVDDLLREGLLARDPEREAVRGRGVLSVQVLEGGPVSKRQSAVERQVLPIFLLHEHFVPSAPVSRVRMYSRPGCGLCDEAREVILAERERTPFAFEEVDISGDDALELEYGIRIPVVEIDGEERFELTVDPASFARALRGA